MHIFLEAALYIFIPVHVVAAIALYKKRNDYADILWGPGQFLAAIGALTLPLEGNKQLALLCLFFWSFRLFYYLGFRVLSHKKEDQRYLDMRQSWKKSENLQSYFKVFVLQGFLMIVNAAPVIWISSQPSQKVGLWETLGFLIWLFGFLFETVADQQLKKFKSRPENRGKIMTQGLWSWSRHPNYFGEITQWWGLYFMALAVPGGAYTIIGPIFITFFLLKVSGIPLQEKNMQNRPGYAEYAARTSTLIPSPPRQQADL